MDSILYFTAGIDIDGSNELQNLKVQIQGKVMIIYEIQTRWEKMVGKEERIFQEKKYKNIGHFFTICLRTV